MQKLFIPRNVVLIFNGILHTGKNINAAFLLTPTQLQINNAIELCATASGFHVESQLLTKPEKTREKEEHQNNLNVVLTKSLIAVTLSIKNLP